MTFSSTLAYLAIKKELVKHRSKTIGAIRAHQKPQGQSMRRSRDFGQKETLDRNISTVKNNHSSYERYKAKLHAIFDGRAPLPEHLRENSPLRELVPEPPMAIIAEPKEVQRPVSSGVQRRLSPSNNAYGIFIDALKKASTTEEMKGAVSALKEANLPFPQDEDLLSKVLTYPDNAVVLEALDQLETLLAKISPKNPRLLISRLDNATFECGPGQTKERIQKIKEKLKS